MGRYLSTAPRARVWRPEELSSYQGQLLLDTHVWLWHLEDDASQMNKRTPSLLDRSGKGDGLLVSDISWWEVAVKAAKGRLTFSVDAAVWLARAAQAPGIRFLPLDREILFLSTRLAGTVHNDPADRMLLATAQLRNVPLVTADKLIVDYARTHPGTPVVDARR